MAELDESPPSALPNSSPPISLCLSPVTFQSNDETIVDEYYLENLSNESLNEAMPKPLKRPRSDEDADTVIRSSTSTSGFSLTVHSRRYTPPVRLHLLSKKMLEQTLNVLRNAL